MNFSPSLLWNVFKYCNKYEVVHIQSWWNPIAVLSAMICYFKGIVPIISPRGSLTTFTFEHRNRFLKRCIHLLIGRRLLQKSVIHVTSVQELEEVQKYINTQRIYVVPNIVELPMRIYGVPDPDNILKLVFVGRIDPAKNLELLFKALQSIGKISFILNIIGNGKRDYEEELKEKTKFSPNIIWHGNLDGDEKFKIMAKSDLLVMPSLTENFGNVVIESLSQGTPVLISNQVGTKDFVDQFKLGWIIELETDKWADALSEIWNQKDQLNNIRSKAPEIIASYFKPEKIIQSYLNIYDYPNCGQKEMSEQWRILK